MDIDEPTFRTILITYKHKTHSVDSDGKVISNADMDFYIDNDTVHVVESKPAKRYGDYFMRQIANDLQRRNSCHFLYIYVPMICISFFLQLEGLMTDVDRIKLE